MALDEPIVREALVNIVGDHGETVAQTHRSERTELFVIVRAAGRIGRAVENDSARSRPDRGFERGGCHPKPVLLSARYDDRGRIGERQHVDVAHPVRRRHEHLVALLEEGEKRVQQRMLPAATGHDFRRRVREVVVAGQLRDHGFLQLERTADRRVLRPACGDRLRGRRLDVLRRVEIRLAGTEIDDVPALATQFGERRGDRQSRRRLDLRETGAQTNGLTAHEPTLSLRRFKTTSGTRPSTSPPSVTTSFTSRELV